MLEEHISFTELLPQELSIEPIRADSMILLQSLPVILHLEFQTDPDHESRFAVLTQTDDRASVSREGLSLDLTAQATGLTIAQLEELEVDR